LLFICVSLAEVLEMSPGKLDKAYRNNKLNMQGETDAASGQLRRIKQYYTPEGQKREKEKLYREHDNYQAIGKLRSKKFAGEQLTDDEKDTLAGLKRERRLLRRS
jgi:hypothetical protein